MRQLDNYDQFFDNEGNFLVGALVFCKKGTSTQEVIYSWDSENEQYVAVNPVQFISVDGRPATQLYLADKDYTIYVNKYIGDGDMMTDTDPSHWLEQKSFNNLYDVFGIDIKAQGIQVVGTLADLHLLDPSVVATNDGVKVIALAGWSSVGDKPVTHYYWDDAETSANNDVDIVNVTGISTGRWMLINEFAAGFDVRNAGCFATATSAGDVEQTYGLQRANTYCNKVGVKMIIPHTLGSQASCYKLSNIILTAPLFVEDRARLYTPDSASLNLTSDNHVRNYPFIMRDDSNTGDWTIVADEVETAWFGNQATNKENWRPTISPKTRLVYNKKFDTSYDSNNDAFSFSNIVVDITAKTTDKMILESCEIREYGKISCPFEFVTCFIAEGIFDPSLTESVFAQMSFTGCSSDYGNWKTANKFVLYKAINGDHTLDLGGDYASVDLSDYGINFCFQRIDNAIIDIMRMPKVGGTFQSQLFMHNTFVNHLIVEAGNNVLSYWSMDDCKVQVDSGASQLINCSLYANNTEFGGSAELAVKYAFMRECKFYTRFKVLEYSANICDCQFFNNDVTIVNETSQFFDIVFNGNTMHSTATLVIDLNGRASCGFSSSSFCDNVVTDAPRDFIRVDENGGSFSTYVSNLDYTYKGNTGVVHGDNVTKMIKVTCYNVNETPSGDRYAKIMNALAPQNADLYGFEIGDFIFCFGDYVNKAVKITLENGVPNTNTTSTNRYGVKIYKLGQLVNTNGGDAPQNHTLSGDITIFQKGTGISQALYQGKGHMYCNMDSDATRDFWGVLHLEIIDDDIME